MCAFLKYLFAGCFECFFSNCSLDSCVLDEISWKNVQISGEKGVLHEILEISSKNVQISGEKEFRTKTKPHVLEVCIKLCCMRWTKCWTREGWIAKVESMKDEITKDEPTHKANYSNLSGYSKNFYPSKKLFQHVKGSELERAHFIPGLSHHQILGIRQ